jgi:hypothetical protein
MFRDLLKAAFQNPEIQHFTRTDPRPDCDHKWIESRGYTLCGVPPVRKSVLRCTACGTYQHVETIEGQPPEILCYSKGPQCLPGPKDQTGHGEDGESGKR